MDDVRGYWTGLLVFARVVENDSFTKAARALAVTPSAVSKAVGRLEQRLGVALFQRSTRSLTLTGEGRRFYEEVVPALTALQRAEGAIRSGAAIRGVVRISASVDIGRTLVASWALDFATELPGLSMELNVTDRLVDLRREGIDFAIRVGSPPAKTYSSETIGEITYAIVAAPDYFAHHGQPTETADLSGHNCLQYLTLEGHPLPWKIDGTEIETTGSFSSDDGGALRAAVLNGAGIGYLLRFAVENDIASGKLNEVWEKAAKARLPVHVLHAYGRRLPARVEVALDFLKRRLRQTR